MRDAIVLPGTRQLVHEEIVPPRQGFSAVVERGKYLRIIDLMGKQVGDVAFFNARNTKEKNSNGISMSRQMRRGEPYRLKDRLSVGDVIFSTAYRPMATIVMDTPVPGGIHKLVLHSCNRGLYENAGYPDHDGCWEILSRALGRYEISPEEIPDTFDVFMNLAHDVVAGEWRILEPVSRPGDFIEFRMEMDCIVGLSNCPMDVIAPTNGWICTPLGVQIYETSPQSPG